MPPKVSGLRGAVVVLVRVKDGLHAEDAVQAEHHSLEDVQLYLPARCIQTLCVLALRLSCCVAVVSVSKLAWSPSRSLTRLSRSARPALVLV